jgi:hypothetical protein
MMKNAVKSADAGKAKRALWSGRIEQWKRSGETQREFCAARSIALSSFRWWRARLGTDKISRQEAQSLFVPLPNESVVAAGVVEIELRSGTRVRFEGEAARVAVARLVAKVR